MRATADPLRGGPALLVHANSTRRERELLSALESAAHEKGRVILAGDTNLPSLSAYAARHLGAYHDAFEQVGTGFGDTFPSALPWLRLDRILAGRALTFVRAEVSDDAGGDHLPVIAELTPRF